VARLPNQQEGKKERAKQRKIVGSGMGWTPCLAHSENNKLRKKYIKIREREVVGKGEGGKSLQLEKGKKDPHAEEFPV